MGNEVRVVITGTDKSGPAFDSLIKNTKQAESAQKAMADNGSSRAERGLDRFKTVAGGAAAAVTAVTGVAVGLNKVMGDGIAVSLGEANAQVALGAQGFDKLKASAEANAQQMGLTTNEFVTAGGQAAMFAKNMGFTKDAAADFGAAMPMLADKLATLSNGQMETAETADMLRSAMAGEFDPLQALGINISAAIVSQKALEIQQRSTTKMSDQQANALAVLSIVQEQSAQATDVMATAQGKAAAEAQASQAKLREAYQDLSRESVPVLAHLTEGLANLTQSWSDATTGGENWGDRIEGIAKVLAPTTNFVDAFRDKVTGAGGASKQTTVDIDGLAKGVEKTAESQEDLAKATQEATDKIKEQGDVALNTREAQRNWQEAIDNATQSLQDNGKTLDNNTEQGRANNQALDDMAEAARDAADAVVQAGGTEKDYRASLERSRTQLIKQARQFGMTADQAENYASQVLGIPRRVNTTIGTNAGVVIGRIRDLREQFYALDGASIGMIIGLGTRRTGGAVGALAGAGLRTGGVKHAAAGGARSAGWTLTGEEGPELIPNMAPGTMVHERSTTAQIMRRSAGGGGGGVMVVNLDIGGRRLGSLLVDPLRREVKTLGGDVQVALGDNRGRLTA